MAEEVQTNAMEDVLFGSVSLTTLAIPGSLKTQWQLTPGNHRLLAWLQSFSSIPLTWVGDTSQRIHMGVIFIYRLNSESPTSVSAHGSSAQIYRPIGLFQADVRKRRMARSL